MDTVLTKNTRFFNTITKILSLALPMVFTQFINVASGFFCMGMLAQLGDEVLAASALIFSTQLAIMLTGTGILLSLSVLIGHAYGEKNYRAIGIFVQQGWVLGFLLSIPVMILFWYIDSILLFFGQTKEISEIVKSFFHAYIWTVLLVFLCTCNYQFGYAVNKKMLIASASFLSVIVLLITAYMLIFGKWGFPAYGVAGLGYAITIQSLFFFSVTTLFFYFEKSFKRFDLFKKYEAEQHFAHFIRVLQVGLPICIQMGGEMLFFFVATLMIGWLGIISLAAMQVVNQYYFLIITPIFALAQAGSILVGHACGSKQFFDVKRLAHASMTIVLIASMFAAAAFLFFPTHLASFYMDVNDPTNNETLRLTILIFIVMAFSQVFDGVRNTLVGILRGLFDTRYPMYFNLFTLWIIGMPLSYILAFPLHFGVVGFSIGTMIGMLAAAAVMVYRWYSLIKQY